MPILDGSKQLSVSANDNHEIRFILAVKIGEYCNEKDVQVCFKIRRSYFMDYTPDRQITLNERGWHEIRETG